MRHTVQLCNQLSRAVYFIQDTTTVEGAEPIIPSRRMYNFISVAVSVCITVRIEHAAVRAISNGSKRALFGVSLEIDRNQIIGLIIGVSWIGCVHAAVGALRKTCRCPHKP